MIAPQLRVIFTFATTTQAMHAESICRDSRLPGRLIPLPTAVSASCGMCWAAPPAAKAALSEAFAAIPPQGVYLLEI